MKENILTSVVVLLAAVVAVAAFAWWMSVPPAVEIVVRLPVAANRPALGVTSDGPTDIEGQFRASDGEPSALPGAWARFRGADLDNIAKRGPRLARAWDESGPPVLWSVGLGEGHAGAAVLGGRVYLLDYDEAEKADALLCLSLDDGREIWRRWYAVRVKRNHGMSRTVPAVTEQFAVSIGPKCHVLCVDAQSGAFRWGIDLVREYRTEIPLWYTGQCPLIDGNVAVLAPGGTALLMGVDCETGEVLWQTPNPDGWQMSHSSIVPMSLAGRRTYVYCAVGGVVGVSAETADRGEVLWRTDAWRHSVVAPSPVPVGEDRILLTAGYGAGSAMLKVSAEGGTLRAEVVFTMDRSVFACEQQTPICHGGHLYSILPNDAGGYKRQAVCMTPEGEVLWRSGKQERFGLGPFLVADDKMFILDDSGVLTLIEAGPEAYRRLSRARVLNGRDAWAPMALAGTRLLLRDSKRLVCLDVGAGMAVTPGG